MKLNKTIFAISMVLTFIVSCDKQPAQTVSQNNTPQNDGIKIAYIEVDSIMTNYTFCVDYTKILKKKTETIQNTLNNKGLALQKEAAEFQSKLEQGGYTREEAENVQNSLQKKQMQLQNLQQSLASEFDKEQGEYNDALHDSLENVLSEYNKTHKYTYILSKIGDNILYAEKKFDITDDIVKALNKRYIKSEATKKSLEK